MLKYFVGGPDVVMVDSEFFTSENISTSLAIVLEGYPRPNVTFTLDNETISTVKVTTDGVYYRYRYEVTLPAMSRKMIGKKLRYEAKGFKSSPLIGEILIKVSCKYFHVDKTNNKQSLFFVFIF